jgi:hypothetical protein
VVLAVNSGPGYTIGTDAGATVEIADNDTPLPSLSVDDITVVEGDKFNNKITVTIRLSEPSADPVTVTLKTANGTAIWGEDYTTLETTLTFNPGETSKQVTVRVIGDKTAELKEEYFELQLLDPTNAVVATDGNGVVTILDDDSAYLLAAETAKDDHEEVDLLTEAQLAPIVDEAIARWESALIGTEIDVEAILSGIEFEITDFKDLTLGLAESGTITIDADAAGWGWYVDETPTDDSEFDDVDGGEEENRMDLLTAVMHEMGHVLGYDDAAADADNLMSGTLDAGERLVVIDTDLLNDGEEEALTGPKKKEKDSWLINFLMKNARDNANPFEPREIIRIVMSDDEITEEA